MEAATSTRNSEDGALFSPQPQQIEVYPSGIFVDLLEPQPEQIQLRDISHHLAMCCRYAGGIKRFYSVAEHSVLVHDLLAHIIEPARYPIRLGDLQRAALLHDAAEAYLGDVTAPAKYALRALQLAGELEEATRKRLVREGRDDETQHLGPAALEHMQRFGQRLGTRLRDSSYDELEQRMERVIADRFGLDHELFEDDDLRLADLWAMKLEAAKLTRTGGANWRWPGELPNQGKRPLNVEFVGGMRPEFAEIRLRSRMIGYWPGEF